MVHLCSGFQSRFYICLMMYGPSLRQAGITGYEVLAGLDRRCLRNKFDGSRRVEASWGFE